MHTIRSLTAVTLALATFLAAGCRPTEIVTRPTSNRAQPTIDDLRATTDVMAESLAADLTRLIDDDFGGNRVVLFIGDIANNTRTATGDFELINRRIKSTLMKNGMFRDNVQVRETSSRVRDLSRRERSTPTDKPVGGADDTAPEEVFFLNGTASSTTRRSESQYFLEYELMRESNGELVWNEGYEIRYGNR